MKYFLSTLISISLIFGSLHAASSSAGAAAPMSLIPCAEPLPYDKDLSDLELLTRPEQFKSDIARMALVMEVAEIVEAGRQKDTLCMPPLHIRCLVSHPSMGGLLKSCSSNLGQFFYERSKSSSHHPSHDVHEAVADLVTKSKAMWHATPAEERESWLLNECAQHSCSATRIRFPGVRATFEQTLVESVQAKAKDTSVYASFGSGFAEQDVRLLQLLAERGVHVDTVVAIDTGYNTLMYQLTHGNEDGSAELAPDEPLLGKFKYHEICHNGYHHEFDTRAKQANIDVQDLIGRIQQRDQVAYSVMAGIGSPALEAAFINTLHLYAAARVVDQFKKAVLKVQPGLKRMYVAASVTQYMQDCTTHPELRADVLNGCDFVHLRSAASDAQWRKCWDDFHSMQEHCLAPSAVSCALMTMARNQALMQVYHEKDKKIQQWEFLEGACRQLSEGEVDHNRTRDFLFALTNPVAASKPAVSAEQLQPTQVAAPPVVKTVPRAQQRQKKTICTSKRA